MIAIDVRMCRTLEEEVHFDFFTLTVEALGLTQSTTQFSEDVVHSYVKCPFYKKQSKTKQRE